MARYKNIAVQTAGAGVLQVALDRPDALNALNGALLGELEAAFAAAGDDTAVRAVVLTGGPRVFAAGADIKEMAGLDVAGSYLDRRPGVWAALRRFPKPIVAAVNGYALGGGCELAMHADIVIAGDNAVFGQPEVNLGIIPGAGGTQRLVRAVGKAKAMKMILAAEFMDAREALEAGLVAEVRAREASIERAQALARTIAEKPPIAVRLAKEAVLKAFELPLEGGLDYERRAFNILFGTEDRREGIAAFVEKRKARFEGR